MTSLMDSSLLVSDRRSYADSADLPAGFGTIMIAAMGESPSIDANKANIYRFVDEALNEGSLGVVDETRGAFAEQSKARIRAWRLAFPDFHTTVENVIAEGDWVAFHLRHQGTHQGEFLGLAPTGKHVDFRSMVFNRFEDGVVVENWGLHDHERALEQLRSDR